MKTQLIATTLIATTLIATAAHAGHPTAKGQGWIEGAHQGNTLTVRCGDGFQGEALELYAPTKEVRGEWMPIVPLDCSGTTVNVAGNTFIRFQVLMPGTRKTYLLIRGGEKDVPGVQVRGMRIDDTAFRPN